MTIMFSKESDLPPFNERTDERPFVLLARMKKVISSRYADVLLLSGGIDSSFLAALDPKVPAITVVLNGKGVDLRNSQRVAEHLGLEWYPMEINKKSVLDTLIDLIRLTRSYDPALLNDIPIYYGLKYAASRGWRTVRTGDAADTLFAGYSYLHQGIAFSTYLKQLVPQIRLASSRIGRAMNIKMDYPYLDEHIISFALSLELKDNILELGPSGESGDFAEKLRGKVETTNRWGKVVLRKAARGLLPWNIVWRTKTDLEFGSGTYLLERDLAQSLTNSNLKLIKDSGKHFWNKMHAALYLLYKNLGFSPNLPNPGEYSCAWCGGGVIEGRTHCFTCGAYPANQQKMLLFEDDK